MASNVRFRDFEWSLTTPRPYQYCLSHIRPMGDEDFNNAWYGSEQYKIVMNLPSFPHGSQKLHAQIRKHLKEFYKLID